jgi:hypothetical protein
LTKEKIVFQLNRTLAVLTGTLTVVALSIIPAVQASASSSDIVIDNASSYQYYLYCNESKSPPPCNLQGSTELEFEVYNAAGGPASTIGYTIVNGTAVDGVNFNIPMTGTINVPADGGDGALLVPVIDVSGVDTTETFTVDLANGASATGTILPQAEVPSDCSLSPVGNTGISMTCTNRPADQTWWDYVLCPTLKSVVRDGNQVTGDGTSTANCDAGPPLLGEAWFGSAT